MNRESLATLLNPKALQLIILPTEDCNFRCTYCYEDYAIGEMGRETVEAIKKLINSRIGNLNHLSLSWFGGEPLIAKDIVLELSEYAKKAALDNNCVFSSDMTTNAYTLNKGTFAKLYEAGVRYYQISLDGDGEQHDRTRKLLSGKGSFIKIWNNLLDLRSHSGTFGILLRVHVHADNWQSVKVLLDRLNSEFGADKRFNIALKQIGNWGGETVKDMQLVKADSEVMRELEQHLHQIGWLDGRTAIVANVKSEEEIATIAPVDAAPAVKKQIAVASAKPPHACYAALPNSFVIRADGRLAKCTVAFSDPNNVVGRINADGTLTLSQEKVRKFMRGFQSMNQKELTCPINGMPSAPESQPIHFHKKQSDRLLAPV